MEVTDEMVETFKGSWHRADCELDSGNRVRRGLESVMASLERKPVAASLEIGTEIHGFANGVFGRDSYECRIVEAIGRDWIVTRSHSGKPEWITKGEFRRIDDPSDRSYCFPECDALQEGEW